VATSVNRLAQFARGAPYFANFGQIGPGFSDPPHHNEDFLNMFAIAGGSGHVDVSTRGRPPTRLPLRRGDLLLSRASDDHVLITGPSAPLILYNIAFSAVAWQTYTTLAGLDPSWITSPSPVTGRFDPDAADALRPFELVVARFLEGPTMLDLFRFWTDTIPFFLQAARPGRPSAEPPAWLAAAVSEMGDDDNLRGGAPRLLSLAHVSTTHLARMVRRYYGTSPSGLVTFLRVRRAAHLLATTSDTVSAIAERCGFGTHSYFSSVFLRTQGVTPTDFRGSASHLGQGEAGGEN
jgi:AraC family cel operon transcriptional repressor